MYRIVRMHIPHWIIYRIQDDKYGTIIEEKRIKFSESKEIHEIVMDVFRKRKEEYELKLTNNQTTQTTNTTN